jgi:hypothetical protein
MEDDGKSWIGKGLAFSQLSVLFQGMRVKVKVNFIP